jgi:hypothetical protein
VAKGPIDPDKTIAEPDLERTIPAPAPVLGPGGYPVLPQQRLPPQVYPPGAPAHANVPSPSIDTDATMHVPPRKAAADEHKPLTQFQELREIVKDFVKRNEKWIWWLHTAYALSLGAFVATFASKGFERARMLVLSLTGAWLLVVFFFRSFGTGAQQDFRTAWPAARRRFFIMSYLMKNLFQGMLFFLLPFYWKSSSYDAKTFTVFGFLAACAVLSTLDLVFDRMLLRFKLVASGFFGVTFFGCANLVIPALLPNTSALAAYLVSATLSFITFVLFHIPISTLRKPLAAGGIVTLIGLGVLGAYSTRASMPPVPLEMKAGAVGPTLLDDGSLPVELRALHAKQLVDLYAVTDVAVVGKGEKFKHVWRRDKKVLSHETADTSPASERGVVRVASKLPKTALPDDPEGHYTVDIVTEGDQIVGRVVFDIRP